MWYLSESSIKIKKEQKEKQIKEKESFPKDLILCNNKCDFFFLLSTKSHDTKRQSSFKETSIEIQKIMQLWKYEILKLWQACN